MKKHNKFQVRHSGAIATSVQGKYGPFKSALYYLFLVPIFGLLILLSQPSNAQDNTVNHTDYFIVGESQFTYYFWDVYSATLRAKNNDYASISDVKLWKENKNITLSLRYDIDAKGEKIIETTVSEITRLGLKDEALLNQWKKDLAVFLPDVLENDVLTAKYLDNGDSVFYKNDQYVGAINDERFGQWFFAIWLDVDTSKDKKFSRQLLGDVR